MSLKDDLNQIGENLLVKLDSLQDEFAKFEVKQEAERTRFLEEQDSKLQEKRDDLTKRDSAARERAEKETAAAIETADKLIEKALKKDQAAQNEKILSADTIGNRRTVKVK